MLLIRAARAAIVLTVVLAACVTATAQGKPDTDGQRATGGDSEKTSQAKAASESRAGSGSLSFRLGYYDNDDNGDGNPFLDEALTVIEPIAMFSYNLTDRTNLWFTLSYDQVSSASIDRLSKFPNQSGASGDNYIGLDLGMRYAFTEDTRAGFFLSGSTEYDYRSIGGGGDVEFDLANDSATIKASLTAFFDQIDVIRFNGVENGSDDRTSISALVTWYQAIAPRWHSEVGLTVGLQSGFLETAYNAVVVEDPSLPPNPNLDNMARGMEITEELPDTRVRVALNGRIRHYFGGGNALELGGRLYGDDWGITSIAIEPRFYTWLVEDRLRLRLRYRFYTQTAADAYEDHFVLTAPSERTQDSDLADFNSHTFGARLFWDIGKNQTLDFGGEFVKRSDGLDQILGSIGWSIAF